MKGESVMKKEHRWRKTHNASTIGSGKHLHQIVKCLDCGATGARKDDDAPVQHHERYSSCKKEL